MSDLALTGSVATMLAILAVSALCLAGLFLVYLAAGVAGGCAWVRRQLRRK